MSSSRARLCVFELPGIHLPYNEKKNRLEAPNRRSNSVKIESGMFGFVTRTEETPAVKETKRRALVKYSSSLFFLLKLEFGNVI